METHRYAGIASRGPIKAKAEIHSFQEAEEFLNGKARRELASNVVVRVICGTRSNPRSIAVQLYDTKIIIYHHDGTWQADNGGFNTPTTSARCSQFSPRDYFFYHHKGKLLAYRNGKSYPTGRGVIFKV